MQTNDLQKVFLKIDGEADPDFRLHEVIPVFHSWIQTKAVADVMIDVADYAHVKDGPGMVLVCHEAHYRVELAGGRVALRYVRMRPSAAPTLRERLSTQVRATLNACRLLEATPAFSGRLRFSPGAVELGVNDRLFPIDAQSTDAVRAELLGVLRDLYNDPNVEISQVDTPAVPLTLRAKASKPIELRAIL